MATNIKLSTLAVGGLLLAGALPGLAAAAAPTKEGAFDIDDVHAEWMSGSKNRLFGGVAADATLANAESAEEKPNVAWTEAGEQSERAGKEAVNESVDEDVNADWAKEAHAARSHNETEKIGSSKQKPEAKGCGNKADQPDHHQEEGSQGPSKKVTEDNEDDGDDGDDDDDEDEREEGEPTKTPNLGDDFVSQKPGQASVFNSCPFIVIVNIVGSGSDEGSESLAPGATTSHPFRDTSNGGISVKVGKPGSGGISQFEYTVDSHGQVFWDLSHVDGEPFLEEGVALLPFPNANSNIGNCYAATCNAGEHCPPHQAYTQPEDHGAMRDCGSETEIVMITCSGDKSSAELTWSRTGAGAPVPTKYTSKALAASEHIADAGHAAMRSMSATNKNTVGDSVRGALVASVAAGLWFLV